MIILDFGSGETCRNDKEIGFEMIDKAIEAMGSRKDLIIKWQLFKEAKDGDKELLPLMPLMFEQYYKYASEKGVPTTASVFDEQSLETLLKFPIPFIKIANNTNLYRLVNFIPRGLPIYYSCSNQMQYDFRYYHFTERDVPLACVSRYPASLSDYESIFNQYILCRAVSDHTPGIDLYKKYKPMVIEKHFKLENSIGADSGEFAITPKQLKEMIS